MKNKKEALVIGPFGFGKVHIREYLNKKFNKIYLLSKNFNKAKSRQKEFNLNHGAQNKIFFLKKKDLVSLKKDLFVSICSPNDTHLDYLNNKNIRNKNVLCEKPLIWDKSNKLHFLKKKTNQILKKCGGKIIFNDFSRYYTQQIKKKAKIIKINRIEISYEVKSKNEKNLSVDLLIHLIAMTQELIDIDGVLKIINLEKKKNVHYYKFYLNETLVIFELKNKNINKSKLKIKLNKQLFIRNHKYLNGNIEVSFIHNKKEIKIKNPINIGFERFIDKTNNLNYSKKQLEISNLFFKLISI